MDNNNKPWTADDIRENASNWSLQADAKLLEFMQNITKNIQERGNQSTHNLHTMALDLDRTKIALDNATNQLMALQHNQFVENRVYDDDETLTNVENVPTPSDRSESETRPSMTSALQKALATGAKMVDKYFDKVQLDLSDSEDDDNEIKNVVLHPKDPYKDRPLPYLIGSKEWYEKCHIGLVETDSEYATASDNENDDSASSTPSHSMSTNVPGSLSESEPSPLIAPFPHKVARDLSPYSSSENLSQVQHESSFDTIDRTNASRGERSSQQIDPRDFNANNSIFVKQRQPNPTHVTPNLIDSEPPALDNETPAAQKKPVNLFMDDDDDNNSNDFNIFDDVNANSVAGKRPSNASHPNQAQKRSNERRKNPVNLFAEDDTDDFETMLPSSSKTVSSIMQRKVNSKITNLFEDDDDDDNDDESDLFMKTAASTISSNASLKKDVFMCNLFDDEPPEDDSDVFRTTSKPAAKAKVEDVRENQNPLNVDEDINSERVGSTKPKGRINLFDDQPPDDDFDVFKSSSKPAVDVIAKNFRAQDPEVTSEPKVGTNIIKSINLFDDEPPVDFDVFKSTANTEKPKSKVIVKSSAPPEDDYGIFKSTSTMATTETKVTEPKLIAAVDNRVATKKAATKVISKINLFDDDYDDDDIFKGMTKLSSQPKPISNEIKEEPKSASKTKGLWDSDEEVPIEVKPSKSNVAIFTKPNNPYDVNRLFDDTPPDDDEDLFASKPTKPKAVTIISKARGEFYNDFLETIVVKPDEASTKIEDLTIENEIRQEALAEEAPSKQVLPEQSISKKASTEKESRMEHLAQENKPSAIAKKIDLLTKSAKSDESKSEIESAARPQPKKLSVGKIEINVAALLPGAKRTKTAEQHTEPGISSESEIDSNPPHKPVEISDVKTSTTTTASQDNVDDTGRLTNLNRDRAKVVVNRRPSTRRGRQQQYQKTLDESESVDSVDNQSEISIPAYEVFEPKYEEEKDLVSKQSNKLEQTKSLEEILDDKLMVTKRSAEKIANELPPEVVQENVDTEPELVDVEIDTEPLDDYVGATASYTLLDATVNTNESAETHESNVASQETSKSFLDTSIFDDDLGNNDSDIFVKIPAKTKMAVPIKVTPAFIADLPPDLDPADESTFSVKNNQNASLLSKNAVDLFDDDDDDDFDNEHIFSSQQSSESKTQANDESSDLPTPSDDWSAYPPAMPSAANAPSVTSALTNTVFLDKSPPSLGLKKSLSLFGGSDSDDDDIFGSTKKSAVPQVIKAESVSTPSSYTTSASTNPDTSRLSIVNTRKIFSDESSDDDLFGGGGGVKKKISASQSKTDAPKTATKIGKSVRLFSDSDDDDDDLFGGKSKKVSVPTKKASATEATRPAKAAAPGETASSNPLSDLLK